MTQCKAAAGESTGKCECLIAKFEEAAAPKEQSIGSSERSDARGETADPSSTFPFPNIDPSRFESAVRHRGPESRETAH